MLFNIKEMETDFKMRLLVFYKNLPPYNPIKAKGYENHGKGQRKGNTNRNYGQYENLPKNENLGNMKFPTSIITLKKTHPAFSIHPTEKPIELFRYLIRTFTNEGDLVLDNCIGSGTTAVACKQTNRRFIGIELNPEYVEIANKRLNQETLNDYGGDFNPLTQESLINVKREIPAEISPKIPSGNPIV